MQSSGHEQSHNLRRGSGQGSCRVLSLSLSSDWAGACVGVRKERDLWPECIFEAGPGPKSGSRHEQNLDLGRGRAGAGFELGQGRGGAESLALVNGQGRDEPRAELGQGRDGTCA